MKLLNWTKIPNIKIPKTWWNPNEEYKKLEKEFPVTLTIEDLEAQFAAKIIEQKRTIVVQEYVQILDAKRGKNCGIMLQSRFKRISFDDLVMAIVTCNREVLSAADVNALKQNIPTADEIRALEAYDGPESKLPAPERWFLKIKEYPGLEPRLECLEYLLMFEDIVLDVQPFIQCAYYALKQINTSPKLKAIMRLILKIGNYMNGGTQRGGAYGYTFNSLEKLKDTKSTDNKYNLVHFLYWHLEKPENQYLQNWPDELPQIPLATKVSMDMLRPGLGVLSKGVRDIDVLLRSFKPMHEQDQFSAIFTPFLEDCSERTKMVERDFARMEAEYHKFLQSWLLEEPTTPLDSVFILLDNLINDYTRARNEIIGEREMQAKKLEREAKKEERYASLLSEKKANPVSTVEDVTAAIRSGVAFRDLRAQATSMTNSGNHATTTASTTTTTTASTTTTATPTVTTTTSPASSSAVSTPATNTPTTSPTSTNPTTTTSTRDRSPRSEREHRSPRTPRDANEIVRSTNTAASSASSGARSERKRKTSKSPRRKADEVVKQ